MAVELFGDLWGDSAFMKIRDFKTQVQFKIPFLCVSDFILSFLQAEERRL